MAIERKEGEMKNLTNFNEHKAIAVRYGKYRENDEYFIVSDISGKEPISITAPGGEDREYPRVTEFKKGVAIMQADCNCSYNKRDFDDWRTFSSIITPSGYSIDFDAQSGVAFDEQDAVKYARSIYDNPAEILKIDKKIKMTSAEMIKGYVDIARSGLVNALEKAGEAYSREVYSTYHDSASKQKVASAKPNYQKTLEHISVLADKIADKFKKMSEEYDKNSEKSLNGKKKAVLNKIESIFDEPQRS